MGDCSKLSYPELTNLRNLLKTWKSFEIKKVKQITTQLNFALNFAENYIYFTTKRLTLNIEQIKYQGENSEIFQEKAKM